MAKTLFINPSFLCLLIIAVNIIPHLADDVKPPTIFILGDSTADVGTNNHLPLSQFRADFPHNGVDFPNHESTGRFSNGFNSADYLAKLFGLKRSPPPFLYLITLKSRFQKHICEGVNFASGGAGILDITGSNVSDVPLSEQIIQFTTVRDNFTALIGQNATDTLLSKSLFFISIGSNDIFGYFKINSTIPKDQFISTLISVYSNYIQTLYSLGARKFGIISVAPLGCCPSLRLHQEIVNGVDGCFDPINDFALTFHSALDTLLANISSQLPGMKYSLGDAYNMTIDVINNPQKFKFESVDTACCGYGTFNAEGPCNSTAALCPDRRKYMFWDLFHPTQKASRLAAQTLYMGPPYYVSPINFSQLSQDN